MSRKPKGGFLLEMTHGRYDQPDLPPKVYKNRRQKFFVIFKERWQELLRLSLYFSVFMIPTIVWATIVSLVFSRVAADPDAVWQTIDFFVLGLLPCLLIASPAMAGIAYVTRKLVRDEHVEIFADFNHAMKENFRQSLCLTLINGLVLLVFWFSYRAYSMLMGETSLMGISIVGTSLAESLAGYHLIFVIMTCVLGAIALVYSVGIMYQFPMMVTYELKVSQILKNSLILTATRFLPSVGWFLLVAGPLLVFIWMAFSWAWALLAMEVFYIFFGFSFMQYVNNTWTDIMFTKSLDDDEEEEEEHPGFFERIKQDRQEEVDIEEVLTSSDEDDDWKF